MTLYHNEFTLRRPEPRDAENLYKYQNDWEVTQLLGGFSKNRSMQDIYEWIEFHRTRTDEIVWVIAAKSDDTCLGHVGLYQIDHRVRSAEFAISIGNKDWWGKGLGGQIAQLVIRYGFRQLNLHRIHITVLATNLRSIRMCEKVGFKTEGCIRHGQFRDGQYVDVLIMGLLEEEV